MDNSTSISESEIENTTFCFACGNTITLRNDQISKIPYLVALTTSADFFKNSRDENGYIKLDPKIQYDYFPFILESLSFHSPRQLFTCLPKHMDCIPIIALSDFLGIGFQSDPTLTEVNNTFFSNLVYSTKSKRPFQIFRLDTLQNMAVRFAVAMFKENYDFRQPNVRDSIYWFVMFIQSAYELFGSRLRYHIHSVAEHCFSLFAPTLLRPLKKLMIRISTDTKHIKLIQKEENSSDGTNQYYIEEQFYDDTFYASNRYKSLLRDRSSSILYSLVWLRSMYWEKDETKTLKDFHNRMTQFIYEDLEKKIHDHTITEIRRHPKLFFEQNATHWSGWEDLLFTRDWDVFNTSRRPHTRLRNKVQKINVEPSQYLTDETIGQAFLSNIFEQWIAESDTSEMVLDVIRRITSELQQKYNNLIQRIKIYEQDMEEDLYIHIFRIWHMGFSYEELQMSALTYQRTLDKLYEYSVCLNDMYQDLFPLLCDAARDQIARWASTEHDIQVLHKAISDKSTAEPISLSTENRLPKCLKYPIQTKRALPKRQQKHAKR